MIRLATTNDILAILSIVDDARRLITSLNFNQWTKASNYPNQQTFLHDIANNELYVLEEKGIVIAFMAIVKEHNYDYDEIEGNWLSDAKYYTIHRTAVKALYYGKGYGKKLFDYAINLAKEKQVNLRIDTHLKNIPMTKLIERCGFKYCGIIKLAKEKIEPERKAYELVLI